MTAMAATSSVANRRGDFDAAGPAAPASSGCRPVVDRSAGGCRWCSRRRPGRRRCRSATRRAAASASSTSSTGVSSARARRPAPAARTGRGCPRPPRRWPASAIRPSRKAGHRHLVGGVEPGRGQVARPARPGRPGRGRGTRSGRAPRTRAADSSAQSMAPKATAEPVRGTPARSRWAGACPGSDSWAIAAPSVNSTIEWTIDWGWTTTSMAS